MVTPDRNHPVTVRHNPEPARTTIGAASRSSRVRAAAGRAGPKGQPGDVGADERHIRMAVRARGSAAVDRSTPRPCQPRPAQVPDLAAQPTPEIDGGTGFPGGLGGKQFRR